MLRDHHLTYVSGSLISVPEANVARAANPNNAQIWNYNTQLFSHLHLIFTVALFTKNRIVELLVILSFT